MEKKIIEGQDLEECSGGNNYVVNTGDSRMRDPRSASV